MVCCASIENVSPTTRELARRLSGTDEILLLWHPESEQIELSIRDIATGASFDLEVVPDSAIDAFYHPYAYLAWRGKSDGVDGTKAVVGNG
jgi:hypothetical protein